MLHRVKIQNFQCHKHADIQFDDKITVLLGNNNVGKSAIIRAIKWVLFNSRPTGTFISKGESCCRVTLYIDDHVIERIKDNDSNIYLLDGKEFRSFGTDVPEPIRNILNVDIASVQNQHDSPFWFSLSSGKVHKEINAIAGIDTVDLVLKEIKRNVSDISYKIDYNNEVIKLRTKFLKETEWTEEAIKLSRSIKDAVEYVTDISIKADKIEEIFNLVTTHSKKINRLDKIISRGNNILTRYKEVVLDQNRVEEIGKKINTLNKYMLFHGVKYFSHEVLEKIEKDLDKVQQIDKYTQQIQNERKAIARSEIELYEIIENLKQLEGDTCPTCGNEIKTDNLLSLLGLGE